MKKTGRTQRYFRYICAALAVVLGLIRPYAALAVEEGQETMQESEESAQTAQDTLSENELDGEPQYITGFEALAEEDAYFPCMYKPALEELSAIFPETILIWTEGAEEPAELGVTWECTEDFGATRLDTYVFYPKWDETQYAIADTAADSVTIPSVTVTVPKGMISDLQGAKNALQEILLGKNVLALVYLCDEYEVKKSPSYESETVRTVPTGQSVQIVGVELDMYGSVWYQVRFYREGTEYTGYVEKKYLATSDEDFIGWEGIYLETQQAAPMARRRMAAASVSYPDVEQFPASYQNALRALKEKHPNWIFVRMNTGVDWNTAIAKELGDKSLIHSSVAGSWQNGASKEQGWSYASEGILKYYMDPRNFLNEDSIFQFEQLTYNETYHTTTAVQEVLKNSFMSSTIPGDSQTYAQAFTEIGQNQNISPFHLAARVLQEQGTKGTSPLISGTYAGYEGYYNYFNVKAAGGSNTVVIVNGLTYAKSAGWDTRYKSLEGGAKVLSGAYIPAGQDTLYLQKFNVSNGKYENFTHQYMQNIMAPFSEASTVKRAYQNVGVFESGFTFKIPVYNNMPSAACSQPEKTDVITLNKTSIGSLAVDKKETLIPYVNGSKVDYVSDMTFTSSNPSVAVVDSQGRVTALSPGTATISCTRTKANTATCTVTVVKGTPNVLTPDYRTCTYRDGLKLADVSLPDGWTWQNADTRIVTGTASYAAVYTPEDTTRYNSVTKQVNVTVTKAIPTQVVPDGIETKPGVKLGDIALPGGFAWESDTGIVLQEAGTYTFYASYNPDEKNYETVSHIAITVQVLEEEKGPFQGEASGGNGGSGTGTGGGSGSGTGTGGNGSGSGTGTEGSGDGKPSGGGNNDSKPDDGSGDKPSGGGNNDGKPDDGSGDRTPDGGNNDNKPDDGSGDKTPDGGNNDNKPGDGNGDKPSGDGDESGSDKDTSNGDTSKPGDNTTGGNKDNVTSSDSMTNGGGGTGNDNGTTSSDSTTNTGNGNGNPPASTGNNGNSQSSGGGAPMNTLPGNTASTKPADNTTGNNTAQQGNNQQNHAQQGNSQQNNAQQGNNQQNNTQQGGNQQNNTQQGGTQQNNTQQSNTPQNSVQQGGTQQNNAQQGSNQQNDEQAGSSQTNNDQNDNSQQGNAVPGQTAPEENYNRPSVRIPMEDTTILTSEKLQTAKEQNYDLLLDMGDYVSWSIHADGIDSLALTDVDMRVTLQTENVPTGLIAEILAGNQYLEFTTVYDGAGGFEPVLNIALNPENGGKYANLFRYEPETGTLAFVTASVVGADGTVAFSIEQAASYILIVSDSVMSAADSIDAPEGGAEKGAPWKVLAGVLGGVCLPAAGYGALSYKKKSRGRKRGEEDDDEEYEDESEDEEEDDEENDDDVDEAEYFDEEDDIDVFESAAEEAAAVTAATAVATVKAKKAEPETDKKKKAPEPEESDWIEDDEWNETENPTQEPQKKEPEHCDADDWMDDDEWETANDWVDDEEWEKMNGRG